MATGSRVTHGERVASGVVVAGHGAASGSGSDRYPGGTLALQIPIFARLGLDLAGMFHATLNVDIAPRRFQPGEPDHLFPDVSWTDRIPPETFSFYRCHLRVGDTRLGGWIYWPHPETKVEHHQVDTVVECITAHMAGVEEGDPIGIELAEGRGVFA